MENSSYKTCNKCNQNLPVDRFSKCSGGNYLRPECKDCNNRLSRERKALRNKYGNPPEDYHCPICGRDETQISSGGGKKTTRWVIDHDHKTNTFRGWLCHSCNMGLGAFLDNEEILNRAVKYLNRDKQKSLLRRLLSCLDK